VHVGGDGNGLGRWGVVDLCVRCQAQGPFCLADGRMVWLRPILPDDAPRLMDLVRRLSPTSLRRRFLRASVQCDPREALRLASVDQLQAVAVAAVPSAASDGPILAVGRFHGDGSDRAELALLVEDAYQRVGLGRLLLTRLLREARRRQLRIFDGYVEIDNKPVLNLLRTTGLPLEVNWYSGNVLTIKLHLAASA
jgi:GNAT superfamily N-acetyltransferase